MYKCMVLGDRHSGFSKQRTSNREEITTMAANQPHTSASSSEVLSSSSSLESQVSISFGDNSQADSIAVFEQAAKAAQCGRLRMEANCKRLEAGLGLAHRAKLEAQAKLNNVRPEARSLLWRSSSSSKEFQAAQAALKNAMENVSEAEDYMSCGLVMLENAKQSELEACEAYQMAFNSWKLDQHPVCSEQQQGKSEEALE